MNISGHSALVTGGASGLGAATTRLFAEAGAKVAVLDMNMTLAGEISQETGGIAVECDVTSAESMEAAIATAREAHGPARVLVNCAGIGTAARIVGRKGPLPLEDFTKTINVNLNGTFNAMRLAAADMISMEPLEDNERGVIIMTASVAAFEGQIGQAAYSASKGGIVSLTMPAAREFAQHGVRVLTISPGLFATPMFFGLSQEVQDSLAASIPFPSRFGQPSEYARLAHHMVENVMLNGEVVRLDGALRMQPR